MKSAIVVGVLASFVSVAAAKPVKPVQLAAYDADGKKVGRVLDLAVAPQEALVPVRVNGTTVVLHVGKDAITADRQLFFASPDCTGTPYIFAEPGILFESSTTVAAPGWTLYKQQPGAPAQTIIRQSTRRIEDCLPISAAEISVFPAVPVLDLSTIYSAPFSVR